MTYAVGSDAYPSRLHLLLYYDQYPSPAPPALVQTICTWLFRIDVYYVAICLRNLELSRTFVTKEWKRNTISAKKDRLVRYRPGA
jgi:hypothetical protein